MLISWVCTSVLFCLAFLGVAARPGPHFEEETAAGSPAGLQQRDLDVVLANARLAPPHLEGALPRPCQAA